MIAGGDGRRCGVLIMPCWSTGCASVRSGAPRTASVCTGAFLLAASGALDGRRAVTHWSFCAELARRYPAVRVESDPIFVRDGPVWTSAGVTAGIDLALALVEEDLGRTWRSPSRAISSCSSSGPAGRHSSAPLSSLQAADDKFGALHDWINQHLADDLSLPVLAEAGRHERAQLQPALCGGDRADAGARRSNGCGWKAARRLLSESRLPVKRISQRCGFGSEETMRRSFLRLLDTTPQDYRARFAS